MQVSHSRVRNEREVGETAEDGRKGGQSAAGEGRRRHLSACRGTIFWVLRKRLQCVGRGLEDLGVVSGDVGDEIELAVWMPSVPQIRGARRMLSRAYKDGTDEHFVR